MSVRLGGVVAAVGLVVTVTTAQAGEVRVFSAGAVKSIVTELAPAYEKETGNKVVMEFGPMGFVRQKLASDPADVVIMSDTVLDDTIAKGGVVAGSRTDIWPSTRSTRTRPRSRRTARCRTTPPGAPPRTRSTAPRRPRAARPSFRRPRTTGRRASASGAVPWTRRARRRPCAAPRAPACSASEPARCGARVRILRAAVPASRPGG